VRWIRYSLALTLCLMMVASPNRGPQPRVAILDYIKNTWPLLQRSNHDLARAAADPKYHPNADGRWPVFVAEGENIGRVERELRSRMGADFDKIELQKLPKDPLRMTVEGLLYLPRPYVVPGGRFNEMYGWDSFFIEMGFWRRIHATTSCMRSTNMARYSMPTALTISRARSRRS
jgi:hypothetical protein